ncbi:MAG: hypothetical protein RLY58_1995 [Pseudomonadota bacterium]|jgi:hypothetical protein
MGDPYAARYTNPVHSTPSTQLALFDHTMHHHPNTHNHDIAHIGFDLVGNASLV